MDYLALQNANAQEHDARRLTQPLSVSELGLRIMRMTDTFYKNSAQVEVILLAAKALQHAIEKRERKKNECSSKKTPKLEEQAVSTS